MKHKTFARLSLLGVFALAGCYKYASEAINNGNYNTVSPFPSVVNVGVGDSDQVLVRLVNDANNGAYTNFNVTNVGAGIQVHYQANFRPIFNSSKDTLVPQGDKTEQQYYVVGVTPGTWTFTLTPTSVNTAVSKTVTVYVTPKNLGSLLSEHTGIAGDTITIHAPTGTVFSQSSAVTFATGTAVIVSRAADSSAITFIVGPGVTGPATVTKVWQTSSPAFGSNTYTTTDSLVTPAITTAPTTLSTATPTFGVPMTVTLGGGLRFTSTSTITIGGRAAYILSRSTDSTTATIVPFGGSSGNPTFTNIVLSFLPTANLTATGDKSITVGAPTSDPNATSIATASPLTLPATGQTIVLSDGGPFTAGGPCAIAALSGNGCRYYKITAAAATKISAELRWDPNTSTDLGLYLVNSTGTASLGTIADANGNQAGGPETTAAAGFTVPAGTSYLAVVWYNSGPQPPFFHVKITGL